MYIHKNTAQKIKIKNIEVPTQSAILFKYFFLILHGLDLGVNNLVLYIRTTMMTTHRSNTFVHDLQIG